MAFITDPQTLNDLQLFGRTGSGSVFSIFDHCRTQGGSDLLEELFRSPLTDRHDISKRSGIIQYFQSQRTVFPFSVNLLDVIGQYLGNTDERSKLSVNDNSLSNRLTNLLAEDTAYKNIYNGVVAIIRLVRELRDFMAGLPSVDSAADNNFELTAVTDLLAEPELKAIWSVQPNSKLGFDTIADYDRLLRFRHRVKINRVLLHVYYLDVCIAVAKVANERNLVFPRVLDKDVQDLQFDGVYHPLLKKAIGNRLHIGAEQNIVFLTGANMAGKSTFMKSLGIALYLAHMGFPVAAESMRFAVMDGIYTSINLPDNLGTGASHFYAEVLRVKKVANELRQGKNLFVIFDELFRGTNVKDAYDATIAVTEAFSNKTNSMFVLSTHIIEAGEVLRRGNQKIQFVFLPTLMNGHQPVYTYKLESGITEDRHGMLIIQNERVLEILKIQDMDTDVGITGQVRHEGGFSFFADKQTLDDLNIPGKYKAQSVFSLFNRVQTRGGEKLLEMMFTHTLASEVEINRRSGLFKFFAERVVVFPIAADEFATIENYLSGNGSSNRLLSAVATLYKKTMSILVQDERYGQQLNGMIMTIAALKRIQEFLKSFDSATPQEHPYKEQLGIMKAFFDRREMAWLAGVEEKTDLSWLRMSHYDYLLRYKLKEEVERLLNILYELDVYINVGRLATEKGYAFPKAISKDENSLQMTGFRHPRLDNGVGNNISLQQRGNLIFLTGANMAGKSTLLKSVGINIYLAHMGFPVAAEEMIFSVKDGLYSSINISDNLNQGYSHFYAEVMRVKKVAEEVSSEKHLLVIFDELFKGTNVKDAFDATLAVTEAFLAYQNCAFIISTHIIEVGDVLKQKDKDIQFKFLPTVMEDKVPKYTYSLQEGITTDRQGMTIIENEGILDMLNSTQ